MEAKKESPTKAAGDNAGSEEAFTLLAQGKRHLLVKDYTEAATALAKACALLAEKFGETANECADSYFWYGKALLELARTETGVLGDAIEGDDENSDEDEVDDDDEVAKEGEEEEKSEQEPIVEEPEEQAGESSTKTDKEDGEKGKEGEKSEEDKMDEDGEKSEEDKKGEDGEKSEEGEKGEDGEKDEVKEDGEEKEEVGEQKVDNEDSDEDVSNIKLAWEMLELAKVIFEKQEKDKNTYLKLAEVYLQLGEVSLESETYSQAIQDITHCLKLQQEYLDSDDRRIAETYYQLGLAHSLSNDFDNAVEQYANAVSILELRIKNLEAKAASGDTVEDSDAFYTVEGEIKNLKEVVPDIKEKIEEMKEMKVQALEAVSKALRQDGEGSSKTESSSTADAKPASDISHLVRKKRKAEEENSKSTPGAAGDGKGTDEDVTHPAKIPKTE